MTHDSYFFTRSGYCEHFCFSCNLSTFASSRFQHSRIREMCKCFGQRKSPPSSPKMPVRLCSCVRTTEPGRPAAMRARSRLMERCHAVKRGFSLTVPLVPEVFLARFPMSFVSPKAKRSISVRCSREKTLESRVGMDNFQKTCS